MLINRQPFDGFHEKLREQSPMPLIEEIREVLVYKGTPIRFRSGKLHEMLEETLDNHPLNIFRKSGLQEAIEPQAMIDLSPPDARFDSLITL